MGISIGATRLHFWLYLALLAQFARGALTVEERDAAADPRLRLCPPVGAALPAAAAPSGTSFAPRWAAAMRPPAGGRCLVVGIIAGFVFATLAWDFVVNPQGSRALARILWLSLTSLAARTGTTAFLAGYALHGGRRRGRGPALGRGRDRHPLLGRRASRALGAFRRSWAVAALACLPSMP
jgi:hypothetical protein